MTEKRLLKDPSVMRFSRTVRKKLRLGMPRKLARTQGYISSFGTARNYEQCLRQYRDWRDSNGLPVGEQDNFQQIAIYLDECSEFYSQSTLDQHRGALQLFFQHTLPRVISSLDTVLSTRAYSHGAVVKVIQRQREMNALSTLISHQTGVRAHELGTLRRGDEQRASATRNWDERRFVGMPNGRKYLVTGKGGLCREIWLPELLAVELENRRRPSPTRIVDRGIYYDSYYEIGIGQAFSQSFCTASKAALGFSTGAHGLRHSYVKHRTAKLVQLRYSFYEAQCIVSQEVGHFRPSITLAYYR